MCRWTDRLRQGGYERLAGGIACCNGIRPAGGPARASIAKRNRRKSGGAKSVSGGAVDLIRFLVRGEEEEFVFLDRAAKHAAILILINRQLRLAVRITEPIVRVQSGVA